jgi:hypothetical protein
MVTEPRITRRSLLAHATLLGLGGNAWDSHAAPAVQPRVLTAWMRGEQSWAGVWTPGQMHRGIALPARAHQLLLVPGNKLAAQQALVLARRPGEYLMRMDVQRGKALRWHTMENDRYLGGHAALSASGKTFFTTETDGETGQGLIAERDLQSLEKLREFPSGGIGPHALLLEPSGTLLVANGGILNLPETGRRKLNIGCMDSNLTRLELEGGQVISQFRVEDTFLSLRHLAWAPSGDVGVAIQAEHPQFSERQRAPAFALFGRDHLHIVEWSKDAILEGWDGYAADICYANERFWTSAPNAGLLASWSANGSDQRIYPLTGVGALASGTMGCFASGSSEIKIFDKQSVHIHSFKLADRWDNHATVV